jgi:hypothetical protein
VEKATLWEAKMIQELFKLSMKAFSSVVVLVFVVKIVLKGEICHFRIVIHTLMFCLRIKSNSEKFLIIFLTCFCRKYDLIFPDNVVCLFGVVTFFKSL